MYSGDEWTSILTYYAARDKVWECHGCGALFPTYEVGLVDASPANTLNPNKHTYIYINCRGFVEKSNFEPKVFDGNKIIVHKTCGTPHPFGISQRSR